MLHLRRTNVLQKCKPLIVWLWIGGGVMAFGTFLASIPSRVWRRPTDPVSAPLADLRPAGGAGDLGDDSVSVSGAAPATADVRVGDADGSPERVGAR